MAGLKLNANPTFVKEVAIPVPEGLAKVAFTFKHRPKSAMNAFFERIKDMEDLDIIKEMATGWDADGEFNDDNLKLFLDNYHAAGFTVTQEYVTALGSFKKGN